MRRPVRFSGPVSYISWGRWFWAGKSRWKLWTPGYLLEEETHEQRNHQQITTEESEGGSGSHTNSTQDLSRNTTKWWRNYPAQAKNKSKRKSSKLCTHGRTSFNTTYPHLPNRIQDVVGRVTLSKPAGGKDPPQKDPTTTKNQRHTQSQHKPHPKISKIGRSRRLYHWISQVFYHRSLHHKPRGSEQSNLRSRG